MFQGLIHYSSSLVGIPKQSMFNNPTTLTTLGTPMRPCIYEPLWANFRGMVKSWE